MLCYSRRHLVSLLFVLILPVLSFSQKSAAKPLFDGDWVLDRTDSRVYVSVLGALRSDSTIAKDAFDCAGDIIIRHNDPKFEVVRTALCRISPSKTEFVKTASVYSTDGRSDVNKSSYGTDIDSVTVWKGDSIVITIFVTDKNGKKKSNFSEKFSLSKSRDKLTLFTKSIGAVTDPLTGSESYTELIYRHRK